MKTLITKSIDPSKPPALLVRSDNEPQVLRLLAYFVNSDARDLFDALMKDFVENGNWKTYTVEEENGGEGEDEPAPDPLPPAVEGGDNVVDPSL